MIISLNWLKELVDLSGIAEDEIVKKITLSTAEVEGVTHAGSDMEDVVIAKVETCEKIEGTHLNLLSVNDGSGENLQIATGAPNVYAGMVTALVRIGGMVGGRKIKKAKLAGIDSYGMCCSEAELGIGSDDEGIVDFKELNVPLGTSIKEVLPVDDCLIEIDNKSLTNRPDLWGHVGFARELAVIFDRQMKPYDTIDLSKLDGLKTPSIKVETDKCMRYSAIDVENVTVKKSPRIIKLRLNYCGLRDINLLADLTNYLMLELGTPMHAFDSSVVDGVIVREAKENEELLTLEGEVHKVQKGSILICDTNNVPVAIAGIKGGKLSGISDDTTGFLLESAVFESSTIRKASKAIGLTTDASLRYEKSLDAELTTVAISRLLKLLSDIDSGIVIASSVGDVRTAEVKTIKIAVECDFIRKRIGVDSISNEFIENTLKKLGFVIESSNNGSLIVVVPSYRATKDISIREDLVEEIARLYGYDNIVPKTLKMSVEPVLQDSKHVLEYKTKRLLAEKYGFNEVHSYIWNYTDYNQSLGISSKSFVELLDSSNSGQSGIRSEMLPTLIKFFDENKNNFDSIRIEEIGRVVTGLDENNLAIEEKHLGLVMSSAKASEKDLYFEMKQIVENLCESLSKQKASYTGSTSNKLFHPNMSTDCIINGENVGSFGIMHPEIRAKLDKKVNICMLEFNFDKFMVLSNQTKTYKQVSKYQSVDLDFNFLVPKTMKFEDVEKLISEFRCKFVVKYKLLDVYENADFGGRRSMTLRFNICSTEHTLSNGEIESFTKRLTDHFKQASINLR